MEALGARRLEDRGGRCGASAAKKEAAWGLASVCVVKRSRLPRGKDERPTEVSVCAWAHHLLARVFAEGPACNEMKKETQRNWFHSIQSMQAHKKPALQGNVLG